MAIRQAKMSWDDIQMIVVVVTQEHDIDCLTATNSFECPPWRTRNNANWAHEAECREELKTQIKARGASVTLDLDEVSLVDLDVIHFLATCQAEGIPLVHCSRYISDWIAKERVRVQ